MLRNWRVFGILGATAGLMWACGSGYTFGPGEAAATTGTGGTTTANGTNGTTASAGGAGQGGSSTTTGMGGAGGGMGCNKQDADKDGSACDVDCNDADPTVFPGAPEICGDGVANNCMGMGDPASCGGKGTFVAQSFGSDMNPGTKQKPLLTIAQGMKNAAMLNNQPVFVAEGTYKENTGNMTGPVFQLVEGISLLGGYHCLQGDCTWTRVLKGTKSTIQATDVPGLYAGHQITSKTLVEGFNILGLDNNPGSGNIGSAMFIQGAPEVRGNHIVGGNISGGGNRGSVGISIAGAPAPNQTALIHRNEIWGGPSTGSSVGVNVGSQGRADLLLNDLRGGQGNWSRGLAIGGNAGQVKAQGNAIAAGTCVPGGTSFGIFIGAGIKPVIDANRINADAAVAGTCAQCSSGWWCGGIESEGSQAIITNNLVAGLTASKSAGILIADCEGACQLGSPVVNGNTIDAGGQNGVLGAAVVFKEFKQGQNVVVGRVRNNILLTGKASTRYGGYEDAGATSTARPDKFENNDIFGVGATALYNSWNGTNPTLHMTIAQVNSSVNGAQNNISADPQGDSTGHIGKTSPCINAGTNNEAPATDMDGEARPKNGKFDIGADEAG
jgi:hypothetical protein